MHPAQVHVLLGEDGLQETIEARGVTDFMTLQGASGAAA